MAASSTRVPGTFAWRAALQRLGLAVLAILAATLLFFVAGVPGEPARAGAFGAGMTVFFAGTFSRDTPSHRVKTALLWAAHFLMFTGGMLLMIRWRGA